MLKNKYTDAPDLHPNLMLGSLHLLVWLLFHPLAWCNFVTRLDPALPPNFALVDLSRAQWANLALWRLLIQGYVVWPILVGLAAALSLWLEGTPPGVIITPTFYIIAICLASGLMIGTAIGVGAGVVGNVLVGLAVGITSSITVDAFVEGLAVSTAMGVAFGVTGSVAASLANISSGDKETAPVQTEISRTGGAIRSRVGGVVVGILVGVLVIELVRRGLTALATVTAGLSDNAAYWSTRAIVVGTAFGVAAGWRGDLKRGLAAGLAGGLTYGLAVTGIQTQFFEGTGMLIDSGVAIGLASGLLFGTSIGVTIVLPYVVAEHLAGAWAGAWAGALGSWGRHVFRNEIPLWPALPAGFLGITLGLTVGWWRSFILYPLEAAWNLMIFRFDGRRGGRRTSLLPFHSVFWDELQQLPLSGLDQHLLLILDNFPEEGEVALRYVSQSHQRWAAQAVQIELEARRLEQVTGIVDMGLAHHHLPSGELAGPASALLRHFGHLSQDVDAALNQGTPYHQRLALSAVDTRLNSLLRELAVSSDPFASRFSPVAAQWHQIVTLHLQEIAAAVETGQEVENPYVVGVPLTEQQEIFVGRADIVARIEQLLLDQRRPPLLLYGQRRMGKTSLLRNLGRLLPRSTVPLFIDGQRVALASDDADFLYNLAGEIKKSAQRERGLELAALHPEAVAASPFTSFNEWLDGVEITLRQGGFTFGLLALDEFEMLATSYHNGRFNQEDFLSLLRHTIQHRPHFKVMLAGSHTLEEFQRWASYLINVQVVKIGYLTPEETTQLVEQPIKSFALQYEPEASQRGLALTRGHPALVQLLCYEIVTLKNDQDTGLRRRVSIADVEAAATKALVSGSFFFLDIQQNQLNAPALSLLRVMAARGEGALVSRSGLANQIPHTGDLEQTLALLLRRDVVEAVDNGYRFQVELIRRWFAQTS